MSDLHFADKAGAIPPGGNILVFRRAASSQRAPVEPHAGHILFFTGVRYERHADSEAAGPDSGPQGEAGPGRKRRRRA